MSSIVRAHSPGKGGPRVGVLELFSGRQDLAADSMSSYKSAESDSQQEKGDEDRRGRANFSS